MMAVSFPHHCHMSGWLSRKSSILQKLSEINLLAQLLKAHAKLCCILQVSAIYCSTLAAIMLAVSFPHHCHMSSWLSTKSSILQKLSEINLLAQLLKAHAKLCCILQDSATYCSTLAAIMLAVSFPHHCHMSGWLRGKYSIL